MSNKCIMKYKQCAADYKRGFVCYFSKRSEKDMFMFHCCPTEPCVTFGGSTMSKANVSPYIPKCQILQVTGSTKLENNIRRKSLNKIRLLQLSTYTYYSYIIIFCIIFSDPF